MAAGLDLGLARIEEVVWVVDPVSRTALAAVDLATIAVRALATVLTGADLGLDVGQRFGRRVTVVTRGTDKIRAEGRESG